ncbi:hypothetical protein [Longitalea luteola]|uniref:hypothetical protein n=1 Tax=Longitalea luteola TaxID=2812563 RepID=UPI001A967FDB|nr:hypothetical protein [Longitalea luteola]
MKGKKAARQQGTKAKRHKGNEATRRKCRQSGTPQPATCNWRPATGNRQLTPGNRQPASGNRNSPQTAIPRKIYGFKLPNYPSITYLCSRN